MKRILDGNFSDDNSGCLLRQHLAGHNACTDTAAYRGRSPEIVAVQLSQRGKINLAGSAWGSIEFSFKRWNQARKPLGGCLLNLAIEIVQLRSKIIVLKQVFLQFPAHGYRDVFAENRCEPLVFANNREVPVEIVFDTRLEVRKNLFKSLLDAGVDIISCEDMTTSPDLIMPTTYKDLELEYQTRQFDAISVPTILHICGNVDPIVSWMGQTGPDIVSIEPECDVAATKKIYKQERRENIVLMGGVNTANTLFMQDAETVKAACKESIEMGIQILAPGCAVAPGTPIGNLLAMVEVARSYSS